MASNCEQRNNAWLIILYIIVIIILLCVFWTTVYLICLTVQPSFLLIIERIADHPAEDALPDYKKISVFSAVVSIIITTIICIILACTRCRNYIPKFTKNN